jgi:hypothetical protein
MKLGALAFLLVALTACGNVYYTTAAPVDSVATADAGPAQ